MTNKDIHKDKPQDKAKPAPKAEFYFDWNDTIGGVTVPDYTAFYSAPYPGGRRWELHAVSGLEEEQNAVALILLLAPANLTGVVDQDYKLGELGVQFYYQYSSAPGQLTRLRADTGAMFHMLTQPELRVAQGVFDFRFPNDTRANGAFRLPILA